MNSMKMKTIVGITILAVAIACGGEKKEVVENVNPIETPVFNKEGLKIGYYHNDSINANYKLIAAVNKEMEGQLNQMSSGFQQKVKTFENWAKSYDEKMRNNMLISSEIQKFQEQFQQRQMELAQEEQNLQMKMQEIQNENALRAFNRVEDFTKRYAEENGYDLILQYGKGGQIMYISSSMDITVDVVKGLNAEYDELNADSTVKK